MTKYKASRVGVETPRREARPNAALLEPAHRAGRLNRPLSRRRAPGMSRIRSPLEERRRRENPPHQRLETREVLDDLDPGGEEATVGRTVAAPGVVDVDRIDSHQHRPTLDQARRQVRVDERVVRVTVGVGPPVPITAGAKRTAMPSAAVAHHLRPDLGPGGLDTQTRQVGDIFEGKSCEVGPTVVTVKKVCPDRCPCFPPCRSCRLGTRSLGHSWPWSRPATDTR